MANFCDWKTPALPAGWGAAHGVKLALLSRDAIGSLGIRIKAEPPASNLRQVKQAPLIKV